MEWTWSSWLKDWWRLQYRIAAVPRRRSSREEDFDEFDPDGSGHQQENQENYFFEDDDVVFHRDDIYNDNTDLCYCVMDMNGDLDIDPCDGIDSDCSVSSNSGKQVIVGICAMSKKSQSKPMKEILTRLQEFEFLKVVVFLEEVILKEAVEQWPLCDCLISFHSKGFPLEKAIQYAQLRAPYVINNLHMQYDIQDRRRVYAILENEGIEIPRYAVLDRESPDPKQHELVESEDHVEVNGIIFNKPFVEKPVSAEDHNIYIYYPTSAGGGSQRLFRKIGSRSSVYSPESRVRKTGSFIYEDFMPTDGTDVKVYTVGPDYAHAEARKSPALDGKVERDSEGKEIRYPVILSNAEKLISRKVCLAFKQTVCGFDLLRANGKSYVCDVNGFSFVKNSNKYYDDCAKILGNMILRELAPTLHIPWSVPFQLDDPPIVPTTFGKMMELRCVVAIIRHGDRTPKQKMKVEVRHQKFFEIFEKYDGYKHGHIKLKRPKQLQEILDVARALLSDIQTKAADPEIEEKQGKLEQLKSVLEMYGHFSGINRKVQMKYQPKGRPRGSSSDDGNISSNGPKEPSLVLILKWGGELTPAGRIQAEELGRIFRCMYPGGQGRNEYAGTQGLGLLRLHSTFRHDLKIYASDEGRVQMTAAAFAKGLLALEGELTPILVQMVKSANTNGLLDNDCDSSKFQNMAKNRLHDLMQIDRDFTQADREAINPGNSISINQAMDFVKNPVKCCAHVHSLIQNLLAVITIKRDDLKTRDAILYHGETWDLMGRRWGKIEKDFSMKSKSFDISKIPDIYDCIKYDLQHNQHTLQFEQVEELYIYAKYLADIVIPQEYGLNIQEKLTIGQGICTPLLKKIKADLQRNIEEVGDESVNRLNPRYSHGVSSPGRHVRTRLYFTSESHVHSLLTVLRYGGLADIMTDEQWRRAMEYVSMVSELNYMSQIVIMLYEDPTKDPSSEERFHVELHFSPGVNCCVQKNLPPGPGFRPHSRNDSGNSKSASGEDEPGSTRIDEEGEIMFEEDFGTIHTIVRAASESPKSPPDEATSPSESNKNANSTKSRQLIKTSNPISIGPHHTVSGHEAMDLAKRLSEELASQQMQPQASGSLGSDRTVSPDSEPRARSFEHRRPYHHHSHHARKKVDIRSCIADLRFKTKQLSLSHDSVSATNELPLTAINFELNPMSPIIYEPLDISLVNIKNRPLISPLATNERPLSCTCLLADPTTPMKIQFISKVTAPADDDDTFRNLMQSEFSNIISSRFSRNHSHSVFDDGEHFPIYIYTQCSASAPASVSSSPVLQKKFSLLKSISLEVDEDDSQLTELERNDQFKNSTSVYNCPSLPSSNALYNIISCASASPSSPITSLCSINTTTTTNTTPLSSININKNDPLHIPSSTTTTTTSSQQQQQVIITSLNNSSFFPNPPVKNVKLKPYPDSASSANTASHHQNNNSSSSSTTSSSAVRRQRHSIAGQMNYFKLLGFGGFNKKMTTSANSLFSTAVISGSSSAPNLRDMIPNTITSPSVLEGFGGVPPIRPLETLHNALSLKHIDTFLEKMTIAQLFKTPASSPPKYPSTPVPTPTQTPQNSLPRSQAVLPCWSDQSSMTSSISALSSGGPSSPNISDVYSRGCPSSDMSASLISNDGICVLGATSELSQMFPALDCDLGAVGAELTQYRMEYDDQGTTSGLSIGCVTHGSGDTTPISVSSDWEFNTTDATKGSITNEIFTEEEEEETTLSTDTCLSTQGDILTADSFDFAYNNSNLDAFATGSSTPMQKNRKVLSSVSVDVLNFELHNPTNEISAASDTSAALSPFGTPKINNKFRNTKIQKQISLYEKDSSSSMESKNLAEDVSKFIETPSNIKLAKRRIGTINAPTIISAEDLKKSMTNIEKNLTSAIPSIVDKCPKTKSCANLKSITTTTLALQPASAPPAGSVQIRESFIEPPKRVAKSFHGKTQFSNLESVRRGNNSDHVDLSLPGPSSKVSNLTTLHRQYSNPIPDGSSSYATPSSSMHRFKTTIVKEEVEMSTGSSSSTSQNTITGEPSPAGSQENLQSDRKK